MGITVTDQSRGDIEKILNGIKAVMAKEEIRL